MSNGIVLREPKKGDRITAEWARDLVRAIRSMRLSAGPGIRLTRTPQGTTVAAAGRAPGEEVGGKDPGYDYGDVSNVSTSAGQVYVYGELTGRSYAVDILEIGLTATVPRGSRIVFHISGAAEAGGE